MSSYDLHPWKNAFIYDCSGSSLTAVHLMQLTFLLWTILLDSAMKTMTQVAINIHLPIQLAKTVLIINTNFRQMPLSTVLSLANDQSIGELPTYHTRLFLISYRKCHLSVHFHFWLTWVLNNQLNKAFKEALKDGTKLSGECNLSTSSLGCKEKVRKKFKCTSWSAMRENPCHQSKTAVSTMSNIKLLKVAGYLSSEKQTGEEEDSPLHWNLPQV